jgi:lipocalin
MVKGWRYESYRHSLAAKGIRTRPKQIDLKRYAGTWEQVSVKPVPWFQKKCSDKKVTATYSLRKDGKIDVINKCGTDVAKGIARSVSKDNSKLKVSFTPFGLFEGEYNIVQLDDKYRNVVVKGGNTIWKLRKLR